MKLKPADPPTFGDGKDCLATVWRWLCSGNCTKENQALLAQTFLTEGAASHWRAKSVALKAHSVDVSDWDVFARTLRTAFGHQDLEQNPMGPQVGCP
jgi:hypothetical protein